MFEHSDCTITDLSSKLGCTTWLLEIFRVSRPASGINASDYKPSMERITRDRNQLVAFLTCALENPSQVEAALSQLDQGASAKLVDVTLGGDAIQLLSQM
jgi:hypothetical protein